MALLLSILSVASFLYLILFVRRKLYVWRKKSLREVEKQNGRFVVGLFHPYCNSGGGGERVLWCAVKALQDLSPCIDIVIYARRSCRKKEETEDDMLKKAKDRFGIDNLNRESLRFVYLSSESLLKAESFPRLTLLGQSLGSVIVGIEAIYRCSPDVFIDTMGYAFTYPVVYLLSKGSTIATYTHYPTISTDMLQRVYERRPSYNNDAMISNNMVTSVIKYVYYVAFSLLYRFVGGYADLVIVNSSWTKMHIDQLWGINATTVFPPCDVSQFSSKNLPLTERENVIVSLGQFRPEKNHALQLITLQKLKQKIEQRKSESGIEVPKLLLYGGCRDEHDESRVEELRTLASNLDIEDLVEFHLNAPFDELKDALARSLLGIHTMWNEHFGIAPVEILASGVLLCAHNSGGPKMDIISQGTTGFLATDAEEYADTFLQILEKYDKEKRQEIRSAAAESVKRFSQENFLLSFSAATKSIL
mmetsp:Transcript_912/g.1095  ORF Transcript_912/g.1095 Transcript_912/m.1095 type:complete len:476 (+) Transcript_912:144-1571(+)